MSKAQVAAVPEKHALKHALVTGAGRGIGRAVAHRLAKLGYRLALASRSLAELEAVAAEARAAGSPSVSVHVADLGKPEECAALAKSAAEAHGGIDTLVNAAGVAISQPLHKADLAAFASMMTVNARAPYLLTCALVPAMRERGYGRVVNIASVTGLRGYPYVAAYTMSKHALVGLTRAAGVELAAKGITVNAICPGYVDTPLTQGTSAGIVKATGRTAEEARAALESRSPQNRLFSADEVAASVEWLLSSAASGVNGQAIAICGGEIV
jgi:3-hydroxybutyrate dehydrogenase